MLSPLSRPNGPDRGHGMPSQNEKIDECPIMKKYFEFIRCGAKTVEGRINSGIFAKWQVGQMIRLKNGNEFVLCKITKLVPYKSFAEMLQNEGVHTCLPDVDQL